MEIHYLFFIVSSLILCGFASFTIYKLDKLDNIYAESFVLLFAILSIFHAFYSKITHEKLIKLQSEATEKGYGRMGGTNMNEFIWTK